MLCLGAAFWLVGGWVSKPSTETDIAVSTGVSTEVARTRTMILPRMTTAQAPGPTATPVSVEVETVTRVPNSATVPEALLFGNREASITPVRRETRLEGDRPVWRWQVPRDTVGWHEGTAAFGEGVTVLNGHSIWYDQPGVLAPLLDARPGDVIAGRNADGRVVRYRVTEVYPVAFDDGEALAAAMRRADLVIYTCDQDLKNLVFVLGEVDRDDTSR